MYLEIAHTQPPTIAPIPAVFKPVIAKLKRFVAPVATVNLAIKLVRASLAKEPIHRTCSATDQPFIAALKAIADAVTAGRIM